MRRSDLGGGKWLQFLDAAFKWCSLEQTGRALTKIVWRTKTGPHNRLRNTTSPALAFKPGIAHTRFAPESSFTWSILQDDCLQNSSAPLCGSRLEVSEENGRLRAAASKSTELTCLMKAMVPRTAM